MIAGSNSGRVEKWGREGRKAGKGLAIKPVTAMGTWSSIPLGNSGIQGMTCLNYPKPGMKTLGFLPSNSLFDFG